MSPAKQTVASGHHQYQQQQVEPVPPPSDNDANSNTQHQFATEEDNESLVDEIGYPRSKCSASPRNKFQVTGPTKTPPPLLMPRPIHAIAPTKRLIMNGNNGHLSSPTRTTPSHSPTSHYATPEPPIEDLKKKTPEKRQPQDGVMTTGAQNNERIDAVRPQGILVRKPGPPTGNASSSSSSATVRKAASSDQLSRPKSVTFSNSPAMNHKVPPQAAASAAATTAATTAAVTSSIAAGSSSSSANNTVPTWATTPNAAAAAATAPSPAKQHDIPKVSFGNTESRRDDQVSLEYQALVRQNTLLQRQLDVLTRERNELRNNKLEWQRQQHMIAERLEMLEQQLREHWVIASSQQQQQQQQRQQQRQHRLSQERASKRRSWGSPAEVVVDDKEPPPEAVIIANDKPMNSAAVRPTVSQSDPTSSPAVAGSSTAAGTRRCPVHGRNGRLKHSQPRSRSLPRYEDVSYRQPRRRYLPDDYYDDDYDSVGEDDDYVDYYGPESDGEDQGWPAGEYERRHVRAPTSRHMFPPPRYGFGPPPPPALAIPIAAPPLPPPPLMGRSRKWLDPAVALTCRRSASSSTPAFSPQQRRRHAFHRDGYDRGGYVPSPPSPEYEYWEQPPPPRQRYARQYDESDAYFETGPPQKPRRSSHHPHLHHRTIPPYGTTT